jgi:hypothetical protein
MKTMRLKVSLRLLLISPLAEVAWCQTYDYGFDVSRVIKRQQQIPFIVSGLGVVNGSMPQRLEFRRFQQNIEQYTLFLLALSMLQYTNQSDPLSWYKISGNPRHSSCSKASV